MQHCTAISATAELLLMLIIMAAACQ